MVYRGDAMAVTVTGGLAMVGRVIFEGSAFVFQFLCAASLIC